MIKIASCDSQGAVFIADAAVYRLIDSNHKDSVLRVLHMLNTAAINGVIQTEVCKAEELACVIEDVGEDALVLKHRKISYISYPHEWCASMLKDVALFHLDLSHSLFVHGLFLKDAHPWNILVEKGHPVFVDFTSIVSRDSLFSEKYLESNGANKEEDAETRLTLIVKEIFERMYIPYFLNPLSAYVFGQRSNVRKAIENTTLNASTSIITIKDCLPKLRPRISTLVKLSNFWRLRAAVLQVMGRFLKQKNVLFFYQEMRHCVNSLDVATASSAYSAYYKLKGEDHDWDYSQAWNAKQKAVYVALNKPEINSVLDVACNTGWFAVMAEKLGKRVVAFDIDESCIESLYGQVKQDELNILPLVINFTELSPDRYSIHDGKKVLINASQRLRSDAVIALGIIHHLVLGLGLTFEKVLDRLIPLCGKQLVIEFVDASDEMIQNEPSFFPAYFQNRDLIAGYSLDKLIDLCKERGFEVQCEKSHPSTRTMVICRKFPAI